MKRFVSANYNYIFNEKTGFFARWGSSYDDDPTYSPFGPEILDIEITTICSGPDGRVCPFCYKGNTPKGKNMSFDTFKNVFDKINNQQTLTQLAFGADANLKSNPDVWKMFNYARSNNVIPNITIANIDELTAARLATVCGGVAVSRYSNKNWCYDSVARLIGVGMNQVVIHQLLSEETLIQAYETIDDFYTDERLLGLKAIIFLSLKQKGRGKKYNRISDSEFGKLVKYAMKNKVPFGFDSCSANKFLKAIKNEPTFSKMISSIEPCESACFSAYIDVNGEYYPCSFTPNTENWENGIQVENIDDFNKDVWNSNKNKKFRVDLNNNLCENNHRSCILYTI